MDGHTVIARYKCSTTNPLIASPTDWRVRSSSDFNNDGELDLVWQHPTGTVFVWFMQGTTLSSAGAIYGGVTQWTVVSTGDVNDDGRPDVIWQGPGEEFAAWLMQALSLSGVRYIKPDGLGRQLPTQRRSHPL
jgi:hypothetical protein